MQGENPDVRWDRVKTAAVDDASAARFGGRVEPLDRLAHEECLAGEIGVVGAGRGARLDERRAVTAIRPDRRGHCSGPCRELGERCAILGVRDDQRPIRRPSAKLFTDAFELLLRASGKADAHIVRRRARQILRRELADEPGGSVKHDVQLARGCHGPRMLPPPLAFGRRRRQCKRRSQLSRTATTFTVPDLRHVRRAWTQIDHLLTRLGLLLRATSASGAHGVVAGMEAYLAHRTVSRSGGAPTAHVTSWKAGLEPYRGIRPYGGHRRTR